MRILILGGDGYLGWPTALHLSARPRRAVRQFARRGYDVEMGVEASCRSALDERIGAWQEVSGKPSELRRRLSDPAFVHQMVREFILRRSSTSASSARRPIR